MMGSYVHWRQPNGTTDRSGRDENIRTELLAQLGRIATLDGEKVSWSALQYDEYQGALLESLAIEPSHGDELNGEDCELLCRNALRAVVRQNGGGKPIKATEFVAALNNEATEYYRKIPSKYVLVTSVSVQSFPCSSVTIDECRIRPIRTRRRYRYPRAFEFSGMNDDMMDLQLISVSTFGRSVHEASERALGAVRLLCGLWNLFATYGAKSLNFGTLRQRPLGVIHVGPIHTLHTPDGQPIDGVFWYELGRVKDSPAFVPKSGWRGIEVQRRWTLRRLAHLPYANDFRLLIKRYSIALSLDHPSVSFMHMWGILESLTDTTMDRYATTIKRASWVFQDRQVVCEILESLRLYRNRYVHTGRQGEAPDRHAQLIKSIIDPHLGHLLRNTFAVRNLKEYASYLSLPHNAEDLRKKTQQFRRAMSFRRPSK